MNYKKFISLFLFFTFIFMFFSGIILYIMPHGRVAYWTDWRFLNLNKDQWENIHTIFSILFVAGSLFHIKYNWKIFQNYLNRNLKEGIVSFAVVMLILLGTVLNLSPFKMISSFKELAKNSWQDNKIAPKIPHGELLPLFKLCKRMKINPDKAIEKLKKHNIYVINKNQKIIQIAKKNKVKPVEIYLIIAGKQ